MGQDAPSPTRGLKSWVIYFPTEAVGSKMETNASKETVSCSEFYLIFVRSNRGGFGWRWWGRNIRWTAQKTFEGLQRELAPLEQSLPETWMYSPKLNWKKARRGGKHVSSNHWESRDRQIPQAHWPASLTYLASCSG